ncbi:hypothetical protein CferDRAFT_0880 [Chlorobium ferrooxidans DSM 13031]|uniref:Uncharacterized protein n=1 Tax=Chlorobium ferrooxidans DSM 13031 TaxID=377431 RepID=Q0YRI5_9CHLB|nr:hypothetical protein CferDRAFT_0880 [Chlorobium ferrooxidans DSM 13031]
MEPFIRKHNPTLGIDDKMGITRLLKQEQKLCEIFFPCRPDYNVSQNVYFFHIMLFQLLLQKELPLYRRSQFVQTQHDISCLLL